MLIPSHRTGQVSREAQAGPIRTARCRPNSILHASTSLSPTARCKSGSSPAFESVIRRIFQSTWSMAMYIEAIANMIWNHEYCAIRQYYRTTTKCEERRTLYRAPLRSSPRSSPTNSSTSSISCGALAGIAPASTVARSAWYRILI